MLLIHTWIWKNIILFFIHRARVCLSTLYLSHILISCLVYKTTDFILVLIFFLKKHNLLIKSIFRCSVLLIFNNWGKLSTISQTLTKALYSANSKFPLCVTSLLLLSPCPVPTCSLLSKHYLCVAWNTASNTVIWRQILLVFKLPVSLERQCQPPNHNKENKKHTPMRFMPNDQLENQEL